MATSRSTRKKKGTTSSSFAHQTSSTLSSGNIVTRSLEKSMFVGNLFTEGIRIVTNVQIRSTTGIDCIVFLF